MAPVGPESAGLGVSDQSTTLLSATLLSAAGSTGAAADRMQGMSVALFQ